jgi:hypothetical protein
VIGMKAGKHPSRAGVIRCIPCPPCDLHVYRSHRHSEHHRRHIGRHRAAVRVGLLPRTCVGGTDAPGTEPAVPAICEARRVLAQVRIKEHGLGECCVVFHCGTLGPCNGFQIAGGSRVYGRASFADSCQDTRLPALGCTHGDFVAMVDTICSAALNRRATSPHHVRMNMVTSPRRRSGKTPLPCW